MSGDAGGQEKSEKPTPKKLSDARKEGKIGRSQDLGAWLGMGAAAAVLPYVLKSTQEAGERLLAMLPDAVAEPNPAIARRALSEGLMDVAFAIAPLSVVALVVGVAAAVVQGGVHMATKSAKPQLKRLNPLPGFKRVLGPQAWWEAVKTVLKSVVLGVALWWVIQGLAPYLMGSGALPLAVSLEHVAGGVASLIQAAVVAGLLLAIADIAVVRRRTNKQLKMTHKEIKDEHKQTDGDPHLKGAIRSRQLAMSRNRMMSEVGKADVVLVNPTHVAVALRYEPSKGAPRVVAKGAGPVAAKIRERAAEHRVPMVEDVPLARALHAQCELGEEIPAGLYEAVAAVLAFVMSLRMRGASAGTHRVPQQRSRALESR